MAVGIEDILLLKAQQDAQSQMSPGTGAAVGAGLSALGGVTLGELANRLRPETQMSTVSPGGMGRALKPGARMAGGLVGLILGGGLGAGTAQMMRQNSPAADLLAKLQVEGTLTASEEASLQSILADAYSQTIG